MLNNFTSTQKYKTYISKKYELQSELQQKINIQLLQYKNKKKSPNQKIKIYITKQHFKEFRKKI